jgi:membrane protease YdiL (CAAX protease family)
VLLCGALAIGFVEELLYRVLALDVLRALKVPSVVAVPISTALFLWGHPNYWGYLHYVLWYVIPAVCAGIYYVKTGEYVALAIAHAAADFSIWIICGAPSYPWSLTKLPVIPPTLFGAFFLFGIFILYGPSYLVSRLRRAERFKAGA